MRNILFLLCLITQCITVSAQKLTVESFVLDLSDITASSHPRFDANGDPCALVKVRFAQIGAIFNGNIVGPPSYQAGEYLVYLSSGTKKLLIKHEKFIPLDLSFSNYGIQGVNGKSTYVLTLVPQYIYYADDDYNGMSVNYSANGVSFSLVLVEGGTFTMGATAEMIEDGDWQLPIHKVVLSPYFIGETEVTQELWKAVMGEYKYYYKGDSLPAVANFYECQKFIRKLNKITGKEFRLATESEWEFAARGGIHSMHTKYSGSNDPNEVAWYDANSQNIPHKVKQKKPNELGLYDMSGNAEEWCQDWFGDYNSNAQINPRGPNKGYAHVVRGGSYKLPSSMSRSVFRDRYIFKGVDNERLSGFRLVLLEK